MFKAHSIARGVAIAAAVLTPALANAQLSGMSYQYFKVQNSSANPDFRNGIDGGIVTGLVNSALGPDGLPVASAFGMSYAGPSGPLTQLDGNNQLLWWTPNGSTILGDGTGSVAVPFSGMSSNFFPTGETGNSNWFRTAIFQGFINVDAPASYSFSLGSDDDSWLFIDGVLVGDNGGIKAGNPTTFNTGMLDAGQHTVSLFFADRHEVQSGVTFNPQFQVTTTPEPGSLALLGTGLVGLVPMVRRRNRARQGA